MYLLYLDDSGSPHDPQQHFFIMAGICVFERQTHWLDAHLTDIAARFNPTKPADIELHASPMRTGSDGWKRFDALQRSQAVVDALHLLANQQLRVKVFASVIEKSQIQQAQDIVPLAFEQLATQFDSYLASLYQLRGVAQRGIVIFDKADFETHVQLLSRKFKQTGHANGKLRNFAEVPLFIDSKASRLIQLADMVAYWIFRRYEAKDDRGFKMIEPHLHRYQGKTHGLIEIISDETKDSLRSLPLPKYPFPNPSSLGSVEMSETITP